MYRRGIVRLTATLAGALLLAAPCGAAASECQSTGIGFNNGGSYLIDITSHGNFSFASQFSGKDDDLYLRILSRCGGSLARIGNCSDYTVAPVLKGPLGDEHSCSSIQTSPVEVQQISTW